LNEDLENVCTALDALATAVTNAWGSDVTMTEGFGWFAPAITRHDLAGLARTLASDIRSTGADSLDSSVLPLVQDVPRRLQLLQVHTVPQIFGGNGGQAIPAYTSTLAVLRGALLPPIGWQLLPDSKALPPNLARRARAAQAELDQLTPNIANLSQQITDIQAAHAVADSLPIDLQALAEAREKLNRASSESTVLAERIKADREESSGDLAKMKKTQGEAQQLVEQCEAAYHITTTKGLAGAFDQRAGKLAWSMWTWVAGLVAALGIGSFIGTHRIEFLTAALTASTPNWGSVGTQAILSLLSVGAPLWFAWLATKQIGQRFRLAEDYAFKATVAKAYEGYRKEAARIDPAFEAKLFGSALTRLDEPPLRLVETSNHGSPWHELANSEALRRTFRTAPEVQEKVTSLLREAISTTGKALAKREAIPKISEQ
jgi:hypothetical protein